jgi:hypothetical protein
MIQINEADVGLHGQQGAVRAAASAHARPVWFTASGFVNVTLPDPHRGTS